MKPKFNLSKFRHLTFGPSLIGAITVCFSSSGLALDNLWIGATQDWNTPTNWSLGRVPSNPNGATTGDTFDDAVINTITPNFATITESPVSRPRDIRVGANANGNGRVDQSAGTVTTGDGNWMFVGVNGGTGVFNLANGAGSGGTFSGKALGSGNLIVGGTGTAGRLYVGGDDGGNDQGTGTFNVNTSGSLNIRNDLVVGGQGGTGIFNLDACTMTTGGWNFVGRSGGTGTFNMSGGSLANTGRQYVGSDNGVGHFTLTGGINTNNDRFTVGSGNIANAVPSTLVVSGGSLSSGLMSIGGDQDSVGKGTAAISGTAVVNVNGEFWVGQGATAADATPPSAPSNGVFTMSGGTFNVNNWIAVGRNGGTGTMNISGGTLIKNGGGNFIIGASGIGTMNQTGGIVDVQTGVAWLGENNAATVNLSGGEFRAPVTVLAQNGGGSAVVGLDGGKLTTGQITGGAGSAEADFNGTLIVATVPQLAFINNLDVAVVEGGGLKIDSNGKGIAFDQILTGNGGLTKSGSGTLLVNGGQLFSGNNVVSAGKLTVTTNFAGGGGFAVADGAGLGVASKGLNQQLVSTEVKLGTSSGATLDLDLGNDPGNATKAPLKAGNLILAGTVTINVTDAAPGLGTIPLVEYTTKSGPAFVLGTLPLGMVATLGDNGTGSIFLNVTSVALPRWQGKVGTTVTGVWDVNTTQNWYDLALMTPTTFKNNSPALFDDEAALQGGTTNVTLDVAVTPLLVTFNNTAAAPYTLTGSGKITGSGGLIHKGSGDVTLATANDYTGVTTVQGGNTIINSVSNGGVAGPIGAAPAAPANLVFAGGTLTYGGPVATTDRGLTVSGADANVASTLSVANGLTIGGPVVAPVFGKLVKGGAGSLTFANPTNILSATGFRVAAGSVVLAGPGQTNTSSGVLAVGSGASLILNNSALTNAGDNDIGDNAGVAGTLTLNGTSTYNSSNRVSLGVGPAASIGSAVIGGSSVLATGGWISIGQQGTGNLLLKDSGKVTCNDFNVTDLNGSKGNFTLQDSATVIAGSAFFGKNAGTVGTATISGGTFTASGNAYVGLNARTVDAADPPVQVLPPSSGTVNQTGGTVNLSNDVGEVQIGSRGVGVWNQSAGVVNARGWMVVGRYPDAGSSGLLNVSGSAVFNQLSLDRFMLIGEETTGVINVSDNGAINASANNGILIANGATGIGTLNLNGGTVTTKSIKKGSGGVSAINFNGGLLRAGTGAAATFLSGIDTATVAAGGAKIDTNGNNISFDQNLANGGGGLTKTGAGTLNLNRNCLYAGETLITAGTLGGTGTIDGPVRIATGANLNPGIAIGTLSSTSLLTFDAGSTLTIDVQGDSSDSVQAFNLNVSQATLVVTGNLTSQQYLIGTYDQLTGPPSFAQVVGLPTGATVTFENGQILLTRPLTAYDSWINQYFPNESRVEIVGQNADPDGDGISNFTEFALGGLPDDGGSGSKVYSLVADSSDAGTEKELLMTIAVRGGAPLAAFSATAAPTATKDGIIYTVQGSLDLAGFTSPASEVIPAVTTGLLPVPTGYEYRTFRLDASNGVPNRGFLRVKIAN